MSETRVSLLLILLAGTCQGKPCKEECKTLEDPCSSDNLRSCEGCLVCEKCGECATKFSNPCEHMDQCNCPFCNDCPKWCTTEFDDPCDFPDMCGNCGCAGRVGSQYSKTIQCFSGTKSWSDAAAHCMSLSKSLVTTHDAYDLAALLEIGQSASAFTDAGYHDMKCLWSGYHECTREGDWQWQNGAVVDYTNWAPGEPNDAGGGEHCMEICLSHPSADSERGWGSWNDGTCSRSLGFCCGGTEAPAEEPSVTCSLDRANKQPQQASTAMDVSTAMDASTAMPSFIVAFFVMSGLYG